MTLREPPARPAQQNDAPALDHPADQLDTTGPQFTSHGAVPPVTAGPAQPHPPTASELAFGSQLDPAAPAQPVAPLPLANPKDLDARAARMEAERLLTSKDFATSDRANQAVQLLLDLPEDERAKVIDGLDAKAFANLLDRVPEDQRERFKGLVDASRDPKRKLALWKELHEARASNDLRRYEGDFGSDDGTRTDEQQARLDRYDRRKRGVEQDRVEVDDEIARLLAKEKAGTLKLDEIDAMRERKDLELQVEMKHNVNLTAEQTPRSDGSRVMWQTGELHAFDGALDKLPDAQVHGDNSVAEYERRANRGMDTKGGEYLKDHIDIYDNAHDQHPPGETPDTFGYTVTHEIGHDVAHDHPRAFEKLEAVAGWKELDKAGLQREGVPQTQRDWLQRRATRSQEDGEASRDIEANGKIFQPGKAPDKYVEVDATAMPSTPEWQYGKTNADEQFAEMYAKAVEEPQQLHRDFVDEPARHAAEARARADAQRATVAQLERSGTAGDSIVAARAELARAEREATEAERVRVQRAQELDIIRNDAFHTDKAVKAASARLRAQHVGADQIAAFERDAARAMTPAQVEELEQKARR